MARDNDQEQSGDEVSAPDMDRITATIRRVQAQAAAYEAQAAAAPEEAKSEEEDPIEATIRRVREQAAAHADDFAPVSSQAPAPEDEDPIETTIRRVQEQAARTSLEADAAPDTSTGADEDTIEATIRRVQAQAIETTEPAPIVTGQEEDPIEATIRRVQAQAAQTSPAVDAAGDEVDEDPIEATIRRVQAQAAQASSAVDAADDDDDEYPIEATIRRVQAQAVQSSEVDDEAVISVSSVFKSPDPVEEAIKVAEAESILRAAPHDDDARPEATPWPGRDERLLGEASTWEIAALRLEQGLQDAQREVRAMAARIAELERLLGAGAVSDAPKPLSVVRPSAAAADDDEWDDRPQVSSMQFGAPPRPTVYRDPSPQTATAVELVEEPALLPEKPAARLRAIDADGNLDDRIPRQYRITVEDKRRGVDLVPLHRAMQGLDSVKDMSLLSYSNGVAMVLIESVGPLDPEVLRLAVGRVMSRETLVEVHNEQTMVIKIQEE